MIGPSLKFFIGGGVILMLTGALQLVVRPRKPNEHRWLNRGTLWAGFCILAGVGAVLVGAGTFKVGGL
jgi:hypothetical protein